MNFEQIEKFKIFDGIVGSYAYGTAIEGKSDIDTRGVFVYPKDMRLGLFDLPSESEKAGEDTKLYEVKKFFDLGIKATPNIIELLYLPDECVKTTSDKWKLIKENRSLFMTQKAIVTHTAYGFAQIKKARGQNKLIHNPMPKERPDRSDYCWIIPKDTTNNHPVHVRDTSIDLSKCRISKVPHFNETYLLYDNGDGVFKGDMMVFENTPLEETKGYIGLFVYQEKGFQADLVKWNQYWDWMKVRNNARWEIQEQGVDYDVKNIQHLIRLVWSGENMVLTGEPIVRFTGEKLEFLRKIREGAFSYDELLVLANEKMDFIEKNTNKCPLPKSVDTNKINNLYKSIILD